MATIDLQITHHNITFSNPAPIEGEDILINATFSNVGSENASNVLVKAFDGASLLGNATVSIPAFSSAKVSFPWKAEIGPNIIIIALDPNNTIHETNEHNNNASRHISISAYHTYFGLAREMTVLGMGTEFLFEKDSSACNILAADSDSNVDFSSLQAIGRRENGVPAVNDFIDVDIVLNMTHFNDSISMEWTLFGIFPVPAFKLFPRETMPLTVFGETINHVPVINSTNSSFFRTGILWDTSDNLHMFNRQFDVMDKEDLIFIANVNQSTLGKFGRYDYEIKLPALLRDYKPGSSAIDFFLDVGSSCTN